ncbi:MAG: hypothetical protein JEZ11_17550 [Desulfobacterales bacterium]|nr:hypothetical protein [Desulfobacterales bacterium]
MISGRMLLNRFLHMVVVGAAVSLPVSVCIADGLKKVLVVHSYHETQEGHVVEMTAGIEEALRGSGARTHYFHMDTKRHTDPAWKREVGAQAARLAASLGPDLVITMDDNAQQFFARDFAAKPGSPVVVFGGVNADPAVYGFPTPNVTGVIERPNIRESIELLQKIVPGIRKMVMLTDKSPTTDAFITYCRSLDLPVTVVAYEQPRTLDEWKGTVDAYRGRVDAFGVYVIRTVRYSDSDPRDVPEKDLVAFLTEHSRLPTVGFFDTTARSGLLCGISVSMKEQGYAAGRIARGILAGRLPGDFPVRPTSNGRIQLNLVTAETLGIMIPYQIIRNAVEVVK